MEKKRVFSKSLILLAITSIMLFAMSITSMAATNVSNIRQTKATTNSYTIEWDASEGAEYYKVLDENGNLLKTVVGKTSVTIKAKAGTKRTLLLVAGRTTEEGEALESWARRVYNIKTTPKK